MSNPISLLSYRCSAMLCVGAFNNSELRSVKPSVSRPMCPQDTGLPASYTV
ncbi:hypothetical protein M1M34_gp055 [Haloarcula tailed virus 2]|uniref:Uncharacterized protein n=1 Tax=Haloarcula tailed virus 2 TaxID=2877989 RepID=A0AAE8XZS5_9CAUD|nr:hypothetical protein M1M34_gp001 [Haloarcula tailed virus 2]YP_010357864.1 hypothetical protein M1M34_gp055 [Haloarcula tailed virus 2]UBF23152.1 hypothetical protein HATV-2_gp1 [Haloarcula tailed virus 2]UBF23278.1 hypothetical protein HATV-2_gp127 [Haloarcula tailed virus 2]